MLTIHLCSLDSAPHLDSIQLSTLTQLVAGGYPYDSRDYIIAHVAAAAVCVGDVVRAGAQFMGVTGYHAYFTHVSVRFRHQVG